MDRKAPGLLSIGIGAVLSSGVITATIDLAWTGLDTSRDVLGFVLGLLASVLMLGQTVGQVVERGSARMQEVLELARERDDETARWNNPDDDAIWVTVRWSPQERQYYVRGWVSENWIQDKEIIWSNHESLARMIEEVERDGLIPADDNVTRGVRAFLGVDGWQSRVAW